MCYHSIENSVHHEYIDRFREELFRIASEQLCVIYFYPPEASSTNVTQQQVGQIPVLADSITDSAETRLFKLLLRM